tara:strand:- start:3952 stop:6312 length:2361 start_codon:yes stop_codon:yes gene_type:complete
MKDPFMAKLALNQIINLSEVDSSKAEETATQLFNDISIKYLLDNSDEVFLSSLFQELPEKIFLNNFNALMLRWPEWTDVVAYWSAPVIARLNPEEAYKLFSTYLESNSDPFKDSNKFFGIVESLKYLQEEDSKKISNKLINAYLSLPEAGKAFFGIAIIELAWKCNYPEFNDILRKFIITTSIIPEVQFMQDLTALSHLFVGSGADYNFIIDHCDGLTKQKYASISLFFKESSLLQGIDSAIESIKKDDYRNIEQLFQENRDVISKSKLRDLLENLLKDKNIIKSLDKKKRTFFYSLILGCLITSLRTDKIVLENLSLERIVEIISADIEEIQSFNDFVTFLKGNNRDDVVRLLREALNRNLKKYGGSHIINAMGELGYDEFLPPITSALFEDNDYIFLAAEKALLGFGDMSIDCIKGAFKSIKKEARSSALPVIKKIGGPKAAQFLDDFFEDLWRQDKEKLLGAIESIPDERFIKRLEPYTDKGQYMIDYTYIVLNKLFKRETPEIEALTEKLFQQAEEAQEEGKANEQDQMQDRVRSHLNLTLKCKSCADQCAYKVKEIIVSHIKNSKPFILDEIQCVNCNKMSEFELTPQSYGTLTAEITRFQMLSAEKDSMEAVKKSPIKFMSINVKGTEMGLQEGMQAILDAIAKDPANPENYISLAYLYHNIKRYSKAEKYYKKAVEFDPSYVEPYYFLAIIADKREDHGEAFEWVKKGSNYIETAKFRQDFEMEKTEFGKIYTDLYNDLIRKTRMEIPLLHPTAFSDKTRRNDPCPCGSGKKYKKCCMK